MTFAHSQTADCPAEELLARYPHGLSRELCRQVGTHLRGCSLCRGLIVEFRQDASEDAPQRIGERYRVLAELGRGASASVYHVFDETQQVELALKLFHTGVGGEHELLVAQSIAHSNVCTVFDVGMFHGQTYLTMELIRGETLDVFLAGGATFEPRQILLQLVAGLRAAHRAGVIHRDLKPQNVLVALDGRVVLTDFGLARHVNDAESRARLIGTPAFWAPEQGRGEQATFASDVYSVGLIAYRLWARRDFRLSDASPLSVLPRGIRPVIEKCLSASPSDRFRSAEELHDALSGDKRSSNIPRIVVIGVAAMGVVATLYCVTRPTPTLHASLQAHPSTQPATPSGETTPQTVTTASVTQHLRSPEPAPRHPVTRAKSTVPTARAAGPDLLYRP